MTNAGLRQRTLARLRERWSGRVWEGEHAWFYNCAPGRKTALPIELRAMASSKPIFIALVEAISYRLPALEGYQLVRDISTPGRANIALYVREDKQVRSRWIDQAKQWRRTDHEGMHPARASLDSRIDGVQVLVAHQAPKTRFHDTVPAQFEGIRALAKAMRPWRQDGWSERPLRQRIASRLRPRLVVWDANRRKGESGPGPDTLAHIIGGETFGSKIDCLTGKGVRVTVQYLERVAGVVMGTDHGHAMRVEF